MTGRLVLKSMRLMATEAAMLPLTDATPSITPQETRLVSVPQGCCAIISPACPVSPAAPWLMLRRRRRVAPFIISPFGRRRAARRA